LVVAMVVVLLLVVVEWWWCGVGWGGGCVCEWAVGVAAVGRCACV
jgi:hypothetical protein